MTMTRRRRLLLSIAPFSIPAVSSLTNIPKVLRKPFCLATIDYSAGNEYVQAHYGNSARLPYFGHHSIQKEPIYDAREGVFCNNQTLLEPATIDSCGFTLLNEPTQVIDWTKLAQIRNTFLPQLRTILQETYRESKIQDIVFWNPMLRGQDLKQTRPNDDATTPTANFAASPHIDSDIGAYDKPEELIRLFENNRVDTNHFSTRDLVDAIAKGKRFAIVNAWRNIASFPVRYDDSNKAFPEAAPNMNQSKWYTYSNMTRDEVLLFCQYDRDVTRPSDLWHCALRDIGDVNSPPRSSMDVRCFILFDEVVPKENDRYSDNRLASLLTHQESGCFCDKQAERRGIKQAS